MSFDIVIIFLNLCVKTLNITHLKWRKCIWLLKKIIYFVQKQTVY